ncbi:zinc finger protein basonuclin-1 [Denticeps clupeoides]|uniref:zinc finger protein basonuclin-1 n=1 Tax=Denticeps clupeoides TaxID=299321 RepID=UPI0010A4862D|nr:zinc finger protein basonuclin-1-like [Denticeps clupeoides]
MSTWPQLRPNGQMIGCSLPGCVCAGFQPGGRNPRSCDHCSHGWVVHALSKLSPQQSQGVSPVEPVCVAQVYDISSLLLLGAQAVPTRMKILLDRLYSVLPAADAHNILASLGWTLQDYIRGYMLQDSLGQDLDHWVMMSHDEEVVTLKQFLRFGETRPIVQLMERRGCDLPVALATRPRLDSDIRTFIQRRSQSLSPAPPAGGASPSMQHSQCFPFYTPRQCPAHTLPRGEEPTNHDSQSGPPVGEPARPCPRPRPPSALRRKGRVSCSACTKTFYDKGTLKIHHNAVHLKIKHRCTVPGCPTVFSSLRSRNRHSANPNPRLHTAATHRGPEGACSRLPWRAVSQQTRACNARGLEGGAEAHWEAESSSRRTRRKSSAPMKIERQGDGVCA